MPSEEMEGASPPWGSHPHGARDSGYLAVFTSAWVAGLIKPVQSPDAVLEMFPLLHRYRIPRWP